MSMVLYEAAQVAHLKEDPLYAYTGVQLANKTCNFGWVLSQYYMYGSSFGATSM